MNPINGTPRRQTAIRLAPWIALLLAPVALAVLPLINPAGLSLVRASAEGWSGSAQTRPFSDVSLELAGAFDASLDTTNGAGVTAFIGQLDPPAPAKNAAGVSWTLYGQHED